MNVHDPDTWPKHASLSYWRLSNVHHAAHAFDGANRSLCNQMTINTGLGVVPTKGYTTLCFNCIRTLMTREYLSRSEVVDWT